MADHCQLAEMAEKPATAHVKNSLITRKCLCMSAHALESGAAIESHDFDVAIRGVASAALRASSRLDAAAERGYNIRPRGKCETVGKKR